MHITSTFERNLALVALLVVTAVMGLVLLGPVLEDGITLPAAKARPTATGQEIEAVWENLVDAIRREDQVEALRIAEWLDEQQASRSSTAPAVTLEIVKNWCATRGYLESVCEEEDNEAK